MNRAVSSYEILKMIEADGNVGVWIWELDGNHLHWTSGLYRLLGLDAAEPPSFDRYLSALHPDDRLDFADPLALVADGTLSRRLIRIIRPDGSMRWVSSRSEVKRSSEGEPIRLTGVVRDVTELKEALDAFEGSRRRLESISRLLDVEVWTAGPDGSAADPAAWRRKTGQAPVAASGWGRLEAVHPEDREKVREAWRQAVARGDRYSARYRLRRPDGTYAPVHSRGVSVRSVAGTVEWWHGICGADHIGDEPDEDQDPDRLTGPQIRAARGFLGWSIQDLSTNSGVSVSTVRRLESEGDSVGDGARAAVLEAFRKQGISFRTDGIGNVAIRRSANSASGWTNSDHGA